MRYKKLLAVLTVMGMLAGELAGNPCTAFAEPVETAETGAAYEEELPYGLQGMDSDYTVDKEELALKEDIASHDIAGETEKLTEGVDYRENEVYFFADDEAYALEVAAAYNAVLVSFQDGVAVIRLDPSVISVAEAVRLGADPDSNLPAVCTNYVNYIDDPEPSEVTDDEEVIQGSALDGINVEDFDWMYWVGKYNDPALNPGYRFKDNDAGVVKPGYQWMHDRVGSYEAWGKSASSEEVVVAVLDTGVLQYHEDLFGQVIETHHVVAEDPSISQNEVDFSGHGTHVAGIIAAKANNGKGGTGIEPEAKILSIPIFSCSMNEGKYIDRGCTHADTARAIKYVANTGGKRRADIINLSVGGPEYDSLYQAAIDDANSAGVTICASMGNDATNAIRYPACYDHVIAVAATNEYDERSDFSTYGSWADIAAPGSRIFSTWNGHDFDLEKQKGDFKTDHNDYYASWDGTSMACPVVAGVCAAYMKRFGYQAPDDMEKLLKKYATRVSDKQIGAGIVNLSAMMAGDKLAPEVSTLEAVEEAGVDTLYKKADPDKLNEDSIIIFSENENSTSGTNAYIFTLDGRKPAYKNGEATCGSVVYTHNIEGYYEQVDGKSAYKKVDNSMAVIKVQDLFDNGLLPNGEAVKLSVARLDIHGGLSKITVQTLKASYKTESAGKLEISGPEALAIGKSGVYTAKLSPASLKRGNAEWSVVSGNDVSVNSKNGKVTVKKNASSGSFTLKVKMGDYENVKVVRIVQPATGITITPRIFNESINAPKKNAKGVYTEVRLYNVNRYLSEGISENKIRLDGAATGNDSSVSFTSSAPGVVEVDPDTGLVTAHHAGKAKITCKATDGSGKKASINILVIVPASGLNLIEKNYQSSISYGKSLTLRAALGNAYGRPSIKKTDWGIENIKAYDAEGKEIKDSVSADDLVKRKLLTIKDGKITVNKKLEKEVDNAAYYKLTVRADTTDGTLLYASREFYVTSPSKGLAVLDYEENKKTASAVRLLDCPIQGNNIGYSNIYVFSDTPLAQAAYRDQTSNGYPSVTSSDPGRVSVCYSKTDEVTIDGKTAYLYVYDLFAYKEGNATVTFKAGDGSNKKTALKVRVRKK